MIACLYDLETVIVEERQRHAASVGRKDDLLGLLSARNGTNFCENRKIPLFGTFSDSEKGGTQ